MSDFLRDPQLDDLVRQLNANTEPKSPLPAVEVEAVRENREPGTRAALGGRSEWRLPPITEGASERLRALFRQARDQNASDLLLAVGSPPVIRVDGGLLVLPGEAMDAEESARLAAALVPGERRIELARDGSVDFSFKIAGLGRFRCNIHRERGHWAAAVRLLALRPPTIAELNLPPEIEMVAELRHGLVLVTGPAGSGKSSTIAAILSELTSRRHCHVITIEDPIEYEHTRGGSVVEQIEVGRDAPSFAAALRASLRQDPDVLVIGEMRDPDTNALALTAAETGHLVFSTLHTGDTTQAINRIIDGHPAGDALFVRTQLAVSLSAVVTQQLLPRADRRGRVPAVEVLVADDAIRNLIRKGQLEHLLAQVGVSREKGMRTLDRSLAELVRRGLVDRKEARLRSRHPQEFDLMLGKTGE